MIEQLPDGWQWTHELTLAEMLGHHEIVIVGSDAGVSADSEGIPFAGVQKKQVGKFSYQAAITSEPRADTAWAAMVRDGVGPADRSGDRRSGIILFDGERSIGSYTDPGFGAPAEWMLRVEDTYRGSGAGQALFIAWWREFPRHRELHPSLPMNQHAARALAKAFVQYVRQCAAHGLPVSQRVLDSLDADLAVVLARIANKVAA